MYKLALLLFPVIVLGCTPMPSNKSSSKSSAESDAASEANAKSNQGTSTIPIIIICNQAVSGKQGGSNPCMEVTKGTALENLLSRDLDNIKEKK